MDVRKCHLWAQGSVPSSPGHPRPDHLATLLQPVSSVTGSHIGYCPQSATKGGESPCCRQSRYPQEQEVGQHVPLPHVQRCLGLRVPFAKGTEAQSRWTRPPGPMPRRVDGPGIWPGGVAAPGSHLSPPRPKKVVLSS